MRILSLIFALPTLMLMILPARQDDSPHGEDFSISCSKCHSAKGWEFDREVYSFDHNTTALPLKGQHIDVDCRLCHPTLVFSEAPTECALCHTDMHEQTVGNDCGRCHTPHSWIVTNITDIHRQGRFPLLGAHFMAECIACHPSASMLRYEPLGIECSDCHIADYQAAKDPDHVAGNLSMECTDCHSMTTYTWGGGGFNHQFFPLTGGHNIQDCSRCHTPGDFTNTPTDCYTCHQTDYLSTINPNHSSAGFSTECLVCHSTAPGWSPATFDHTFFPLTLGHASVGCEQCHDPNDYANISADCYVCHQEDFTGTTEPDHETGLFPINCLECHTTMPGWTPAAFDHTSFPLAEGHSNLSCTQCHDPNDYSNVPTDCYACHQEDFISATDPDHVSANFPVNCLECHTTLPGWTPAAFDHTSFPLAEGHSNLSCTQCHDPNDYSNVSTDCYDCHQQDYLNSTDPNHVSANFPVNCMECHSTMPGWTPATFDHNSFPLTNGHLNASCSQCHDPNDYSNVSSDCYDCHQQDYLNSTDPNHVSANFPVNCMECHSTMPGWTPVTFDHNSFPLTNGHSNLSCTQCHDPNDYSNISTDCYACHQLDFQNTTNPNHVSANFPVNCLECHTTMPGWTPATFDHTSFPLTNGHSNVSCTQCHDPNDYSNVSPECFACHQEDYNNTTNPSHVAASISIDCMECHTTMPGWKPAEFPIHDAQFFPIFSGSHLGEWNSCTQCHEDLNNYASFTCLTCHEHSQSRMDDKHSGEQDYTYNSIACLECHPRGRNN